MKKVKEQLLIREKEVINKINYRRKELQLAEVELELVQLAIEEFNGPKKQPRTAAS